MGHLVVLRGCLVRGIISYMKRWQSSIWEGDLAPIRHHSWCRSWLLIRVPVMRRHSTSTSVTVTSPSLSWSRASQMSRRSTQASRWRLSYSILLSSLIYFCRQVRAALRASTETTEVSSLGLTAVLKMLPNCAGVILPVTESAYLLNSMNSCCRESCICTVCKQCCISDGTIDALLLISLNSTFQLQQCSFCSFSFALPILLASAPTCFTISKQAARDFSSSAVYSLILLRMTSAVGRILFLLMCLSMDCSWRKEKPQWSSFWSSLWNSVWRKGFFLGLSLDLLVLPWWWRCLVCRQCWMVGTLLRSSRASRLAIWILPSPLLCSRQLFTRLKVVGQLAPISCEIVAQNCFSFSSFTPSSPRTHPSHFWMASLAARAAQMARCSSHSLAQILRQQLRRQLGRGAGARWVRSRASLASSWSSRVSTILPHCYWEMLRSSWGTAGDPSRSI